MKSKRGLFVVCGIVLILAAAVATLPLWLGNVVKSAVQTFGPKLTGTSITLDSVRISPFTGHGEIQGLVVGNPEGFQAGSAIKLGKFELDLEPASLFKDKVLIRKIAIEGPEFMLELGVHGSNIGTILNHVKALSREKPAETESQKETGKKVQIDDLQLTGGRILVSSPILESKALTVALPPIHLTEIGKTDNVGVADAVDKVLTSVLQSAGGTALSGKNLSDLKHSAKKLLKGLKPTVTDPKAP